MRAAAKNALGALFLVLALGCSHYLDTEDHGREWATSTELKELQAAEDGSERQQRAAQALCNEERGPNSEARWTPEGHLVCTTRQGERRATTIASISGAQQ